MDYFPLKSFQATSILSEMIERAKKLEKKKVGNRKKKKKEKQYEVNALSKVRE